VDATVAIVTVNPVVSATPGSDTVTYTATDVAGNAATPATRTVAVTIANPTSVGADGLSPLMKYAFGASNPGDTIQRPVTATTTSVLSLTAIVRTNDPGLTVTAESSTDLANPAAWTAANVTVTADSNTSNVPAGCVRNIYSVSIVGAARMFLRIKAVK
jgi:hypothetical protein